MIENRFGDKVSRILGKVHESGLLLVEMDSNKKRVQIHVSDLKATNGIEEIQQALKEIGQEL